MWEESRSIRGERMGCKFDTLKILILNTNLKIRMRRKETQRGFITSKRSKTIIIYFFQIIERK